MEGDNLLVQYSLKIPKDRKKYVESVVDNFKKKTNVKEIDLEIVEDDLIISTKEDSWLAFKVKNVMDAVIKGFDIDTAKLLLNDSYIYEVINISDIIRSKAPNQLERVRARVIGRKGSARKTLESLGDAYLSIRGKYVAIIAELESGEDIKEAVEMLIRGSPHSRVYKWLENRKKQRRFYSLIGKSNQTIDF